MRVLFLTQSAEACPASRYRVYQYLPHLKSAGVEVRVSPAIPARHYHRVYQSQSSLKKIPYFLKAGLRRLLAAPRYRRYDVVYFQQWTFPRVYPIVELAAARMNPHMVFDMDEPLYVRPARQGRSMADILAPERNVSRILKAASHVVVGNQYLREFAASHNPNTHVVPTSIDTERYAPRGSYDHPPPMVLGWIGSFTTTVYLDLIRGVVRALARKYPLIFRVIGSNYFVDSVLCQSRPWSYSTEVAEVRWFDIGVMPLGNDPWSRGKSACKALQYMAAAVPAVCTANEVTSSLITDGENGFLASNPDEWYEKLAALIEDAGLRRRIGMEGRETVERDYSLKGTVPKLIRVLELASAG